MPDISQLTEVPEEEAALYLNDKGAMSSITISDDAYSARFRYEMNKESKPKQNYFGMVEVQPEIGYASPFFKGLGRGIVSFVPTMAREVSRMGTDMIVENKKLSQDMEITNINTQIGVLEKKRNVQEMTPEQRKDFYKNDPEYNSLFNQVIGKYDNKIELERPEFDTAINETYAEIKKRNEQWISTWGLDKDEKDSEFLYGLGQGTSSLAGAIALTAMTKNPTAASVAFGVSQTGSVYEELREKGADSKTAIKYATPAGLAEGALEKWGLHLFVENLGAKTLMRMLARNTAVEMIQEGSQQTVEEVLMNKYRPEEMREKVKRVAISMVYGGMLGGAASIVSRPLLVQKSNELKKDLTEKHGLTSESASTLVSTAFSGSLEERNAASLEVQKIIGISEWKKQGFSEEEAEALAGRMTYSHEDMQKEVLRAANAELDPETYEGGSIESGVKFFDKELKRDFVSEDFDIKDKVKQTALENGALESEAELAGTLSESFARVISNITNESPREQWENGGELIIEDTRKHPDINEMSEVNENGELVVDGKILFQSEIKSVIDKAREPGTFKESVKIGKVKNWLVKAASKVGLDITGYEHSIDVSAVKHIVKKHGNISVEDQRGNIAITDNDIQLIPFIVADPDYVVFGTETRAHKDGITYIKRMDDGTTFYVEEVRSGQKTLSAQTLYKKRSVQLTADSIRASVVLRPKRLTDHIEIIANPDKDVKTLFQSAHNPRGYIQIKEMQYIINLLKTANSSTIVHELGHYFVDRYVSVLEKAGRYDEMKGVFEWLGVDNSQQLGDKEYERFARGFETYVMEGVSPNAKMGGIFSRFKQWLSQIYEDLAQGKIIPPEEINDDVRAFFDKMLATDEDIALDLEGMKEKVGALRGVIQNAINGKEVSIDGVTIEDVNDLLNIVNQRIPRKPKNLTQLLREVGIDIDFAKLMDIREAMALQDEKGGSGGLFRKGGAINKEDVLVEFLKSNGFIFGDSETHKDVSNLWDDAMTAIENADNLYRQEDQEKMQRRESILEAVNVASKVLENVDYDSALKAIKELRSKNVVAVQKDSLRYIKGKLKNIDADYKKIIRNLLKSQKEDFEARRNDLVDFIKGQPLTGDSKVKLLSQIKKANSLNTFQRVAQIIRERSLEYYAREQKKVLIDKIQSELKQTRPSGSIQNQKYDYMANKLFADLRKYNKMNQMDAGVLANQMFSDRAPEDFESSDEADKIRRRFIAYKSKGAETSSELLDAIYKDITRMKEIGKSAKDESHYDEMLEREKDRQELIQLLDNSSAKANSVKTQAMNFYRRGFANLYSLMNSMFGKDIADKYEFETKQTEVDAKIYLKTRDVINRGSQIFNVKGKTGLIDLFADMSNQKSTLIDIKEGLDQEIDRFQIMDIYNSIKNEKTRNDYYRSFGQEQIDSLISTLSVKEKAFADFLQDEINEYYESMNKVYIQLYDIDLPSVDNYWPATSEHKDAIDIQGDYYNQTTTPSAFKERARGAKVPIPKSAWEKFSKHVAEAEYITGLGVDYMNVKRIFKSRRVESKIKKHYGDAVYRNLMDDIEALSISHKIQVIDDVSGFWQKGLNNWVVAKIAFNPSVFFNQLTSIVNYTENMPMTEWTKYFAEGLANPKETAKYMMEQAPFLQARLGNGYNEALSRAITEANKFGKKKGKWNEVLTSLTRFGDIGAIVYGGYPYLKYLHEQGDAEAIRKFEFATLRSQQAGTDVSLSPFQRNKGAMRFFLAFKNTPQQYMRKIADAQIMLKNGDITPGQYSKTMLNYAVIQPMLYIMMGNFIRSLLYFNDDDDEKSIFDGVFKQILLSPIDGMPVMSDIMGSIYDIIISDKPSYNVISYPMLSDLESSVRKIAKEDKSLFDYVEIIAPIIEARTALPVKKPLNIIRRNFYKE